MTEESLSTDNWPFPRREVLWQGTILRTIAHAIYSAHLRTPLDMVWWSNGVYVVNNHSNARGAVAFGEDVAVGAFSDMHSPRHPLTSNSSYSSGPILADMPHNLRMFAEKTAMQYICFDYLGEMMPLLTAAFWSDGEYLTASEPWADVLQHGGHLIRIECMEINQALPELQNEYLFSRDQMELLVSIFEKKMNSKSGSIVLNHRDWVSLTSEGTQGITECRALLGSIGIAIASS